MRVVPLSIICLMSLTLAACETHKVAAEPQIKVVRMTAPEEDMLSLGRSLSEGSVDIYQPGTASVSIPTQDTFTPRTSPVQENNNIVVRDPDVMVYSLDSDPVALPAEPVLNRSPLAPVPTAAPQRRYAPELTPIPGPRGSLPDLQPPVAAKGIYSTPAMAETTYQ